VTVEINPTELDLRLRQEFPELETEIGPNWLRLSHPDVLSVFRFLHDDPGLDFTYLAALTAVDRMDWFEVVYHLQSLRHNHLAVVKLAAERPEPSLPSVTPIWYGAHLQEAEAYDLMGIRFEGHPNLRRLFLWEGFAGWPLRKDFLQVAQGAFKPGLPHFPKEGGQRGTLSGPNWTAPSGEPAKD
jgi:NADH-quinone oxidoreductase subunit C